MVTESTEVSDAMIGGNASAEGGEEEGGASGSAAQSGCNIVVANRLVETSFKKKEYQGHLKVRSCASVYRLSHDCIIAEREVKQQIVQCGLRI